MMKSKIRPELSYRCLISKETVKLGETCPYENKTVTELNMGVYNIHKDCENYNPKKDMCLKWFEENVSKKYQQCREYGEFNDEKLQKKWSN